MSTLLGCEDELEAFVKDFAKTLTPGTVVLLDGEMGVGKTTFVRHLATYLNSHTAPSSPTFTLVQEYQADIPIYHLDLYRLSHQDELHSMDIQKYLSSPTHLTLIEWPDCLGDFTPEGSVVVQISYVEDDGTDAVSTKREIVLK